jgi:flavin reductase (DIM6/NTAB) family NADH-FMN oxidoreductase RutF
MPKEDLQYPRYVSETLEVLSLDGALLVSVDGSGRANVMTIGWGMFGWVWGKPILAALVRPSRYTYELLEETGEFTVNVPPRTMAETVAYCGTVSGRDFDKFEQGKLTAKRGKRVRAPIIEECAVHFECRVIHKNDVLPATLAPEIAQSAYRSGDYHRIYYGEILAAYAKPGALADLLSSKNR